MPLLGRHKSSPTAAAASATSTTAATRTGSLAQQSTTSTPISQQRAPICESPLFGIRRQLPVAMHNVVEPQQVSSIISNRHSVGRSASLSTTTGRATATPTTTAMTTTIGSRQSINSNPTRNSKQISEQDINNNMVCLNNEFSSIPQHITRQQIHYAFTLMDTNSDGLINLHDLSQMLANLGIPIDEAILSHVMSIASKRGDRRMTETEFLEWLGNFIQISDSNSSLPDAAAKLSKTAPSRVAGTSTSAAGRRLKRTPLGRSASSVGPSLAVAQSDSDGDGPAAATTTAGRQRRGSGSGLALMRSLSSAGKSAGDPSATTGDRRAMAEGAESGAAKRDSDAARAAAAAAAAAADAAEARSDLRAAFCVFDLDGDGYITLDEVRAGLELLGEQWSAAELSALFNKCNSNRDLSTKSASKLRAHQPLQRISIDDFVQLLL